jgi:hypothetical protein
LCIQLSFSIESLVWINVVFTTNPCPTDSTENKQRMWYIVYCAIAFVHCHCARVLQMHTILVALNLLINGIVFVSFTPRNSQQVTCNI